MIFFLVITLESVFVGVIMKMAQVIKDGSARGQKSAADVLKKPETMIIPGRELVQILAKVLSPTVVLLFCLCSHPKIYKTAIIDT
mgnify:CR=1 FL=1